MRRLLVASALTLGGFFTLASPTLAQSTDSVDIEFSGVVPPQCLFEEPTDGVLAFDFQTDPSKLSSELASGTPGQVTVVCNSAATLTVSAPVQTAGPQVINGTTTASVSSTLGQATPNSSLFLPNSSTPLQFNVNMGVTRANNALLPPGDYTYMVTLTVTAQ